MENADVFAQAMDKIRDEMATKNVRYISVIGEMMTDYLRKNPDCAGRILVKEKTLSGVIDAMKAEARKRAVNNVGVIDDQQALVIALEYFGITDKPMQEPEPVQLPKAEESTTMAEETDELSLDALLGGL